MTTALQLITGSMRLIEAVASGETPTTDEQTDALAVLNQLLESWSLQGLAVYRRDLTPYTTVAGQASYSIGAGEEWDGARPMTIKGAYATVNDVDYPVDPMTTQQYADLTDKDEQAEIPDGVYYDATYPNGTVYLFPVPSTAITVTLVIDEQLSSLASVSTTISFPPGYERALRYALAVELAPEFGKTPSPIVVQNALDALALIKSTNQQPTYLTFDGMVTGGGCWSLADFLADR